MTTPAKGREIKEKIRKVEGRFVCRCECGGEVRGVRQFGRLWTWCTKCSPVVVINLPERKDDK